MSLCYHVHRLVRIKPGQPVGNINTNEKGGGSEIIGFYCDKQDRNFKDFFDNLRSRERVCLTVWWGYWCCTPIHL